MNYVRLDELDLAAHPRTVSEGSADGVHWSIRAECDRAGVLYTVVTYTCGGTSTTFGVLGASLHNGQRLSLWVGRERDARPFLLLRTAPLVTHATAVLASGDRHEVALSPVIENFRLRFGGMPLREVDPLVSVELADPEGVAQVVELWRPPRLAQPGLSAAAAAALAPSASAALAPSAAAGLAPSAAAGSAMSAATGLAPLVSGWSRPPGMDDVSSRLDLHDTSWRTSPRCARPQPPRFPFTRCSPSGGARAASTRPTNWPMTA